jgi:hypothetical protein
MPKQVLNLIQDLRFRHLIESNSYETLKQVQGDKIIIMTQSPGGEGDP